MNENIKVVIALGGKGSRLSEVTNGVPKPLFKVNGYSTLERTLINLKEQNLTNIILTTCFKEKLFKDFISSVENKYKLKIEILNEKEPLGECGALWEIKERLLKQTIFINGDLIFSIDFKKLCFFHYRLASEITLVTHPSTHPEDSDMVFSQDGISVDSILHKNRKLTQEFDHPILGNAGIVIFESRILSQIKQPNISTKPNFFGYIVKEYLKENKKLYHYNTSEYIKDMGTVERYKKVSSDLALDIPKQKDYRNKQKALFLDRDNTLIKCDLGQYILDANDVIFMDKNILKIAKISKDYTFVAIITNQPQISMNKLTLKNLEKINNKIILYCQKFGLFINNVKWCPHHPHKGYKEEIVHLKGDCFCRKPQPGLLMQEAFERNIDLSNSPS